MFKLWDILLEKYDREIAKTSNKDSVDIRIVKDVIIQNKFINRTESIKRM